MKINSLLIILITLSCIGCDKDEEDIQVTTGDISGKVALYDDGKVNVENNGMKVLVDGISPEVSVQTDTEGNFIINNVPFGTYSLSFSKADYGTYKYYNVTLTEASVDYNITGTLNMGQISGLTISNFAVYISHGSIDYTGTIDPAGTIDAPKYVRIFYSDNETVSSSNYMYYSEAYEISDGIFELPITKDELIDAGLASGTIVYLKIYGESYWNNSYEDPTTGKMIIPNLSANSPDAVSFIIP